MGDFLEECTDGVDVEFGEQLVGVLHVVFVDAKGVWEEMPEPS